MEMGALTSGLDVAQVVLYAFWLFFAGLILYLRREDRREGYPLRSEIDGKTLDPGIIWVPDPKEFRMPDGSVVKAPSEETDTREIKAKPVESWPGAPLEPIGDPMKAEVGPSAYALRSNKPEVNLDGKPRIAPMRVAREYSIEANDPDPRGMPVIAADGVVAGKVFDVWIDRAESLIKFLEVELPAPKQAKPEPVAKPKPKAAAVVGQPAEGPTLAKPVAKPKPAPRVMLPATFVVYDIDRRQVKVASILARHFADVPTLQNPDQVTAREEDQISAYFAGGHMYALPSRSEPLL